MPPSIVSVLLRDVLGDGTIPAGEVLSGPFPRGYAYDEEVVPAGHDPRTAIALLRSESAGDDWRHPAATCDHWSIGVRMSRGARRWPCKRISRSTDWDSRWTCARSRPMTNCRSASSWDLQYVEWQAMEPVRDVWKLLGGTHGGRGADPELDAALEQLAQAATREQAAAPLHAIHRRTHETLAVIPLWQIDEYALVHPTLHGVGERPMTLYQNVEQWQVASE